MRILQETISKEQALHRVLSKVPVETSLSGSERYAAIAAAMHVPVWSVGFYLNKLRNSTLTMDSRALSMTAQITRLTRQFQGMEEATVDEHSRRAAEVRSARVPRVCSWRTVGLCGAC